MCVRKARGCEIVSNASQSPLGDRVSTGNQDNEPRWSIPRIELLDSAVLRESNRACHEESVTGSDSGSPRGVGPPPRTRLEPVLRLASPDPGAFRGPRPRAVEADRRQPAPAAALREPGGAAAGRRGSGLPGPLSAGAADLRRLPVGARRRPRMRRSSPISAPSTAFTRASRSIRAASACSPAITARPPATSA